MRICSMFKQVIRCARQIRPAMVPSFRIQTIPKVSQMVARRFYAIDTLGHNVDSKVDKLSISEYDKVSNMYLEDLGDELDVISEDYDTIDFDLSQGVLTLNTPLGTYVINRQPPNKQIWLSSPILGPNRYDLVKGEWTSLRDNGKLTELLSQELSNILNNSIALQINQ